MSDGRHPGWRDSKILAQREKLSTEERLADVYKRLLRAVESRAEQAELTGQGLRETIEAAARLGEVMAAQQTKDEQPVFLVEFTSGESEDGVEVRAESEAAGPQTH